MFGKLVKYEFKSIGKWYLAINLALIAVALIIGILLGQSAGSISSSGEISFANDSSTVSGIIDGVLILSFGFLIAASVIGTLVIIIRRFYINFFFAFNPENTTYIAVLNTFLSRF